MADVESWCGQSSPYSRISSRGETACPTHSVRGDFDPSEATRSRLRWGGEVGGRDVLEFYRRLGYAGEDRVCLGKAVG